MFSNTSALQLNFWLGFLGMCCLCATFIDYVLAHGIDLTSTALFVDLTFRLQVPKPTIKLDAWHALVMMCTLFFHQII